MMNISMYAGGCQSTAVASLEQSQTPHNSSTHTYTRSSRTLVARKELSKEKAIVTVVTVPDAPRNKRLKKYNNNWANQSKS